ncbi:ankyrin repeat protein [Saccharothrix saharensis]|uniref:Ankyrin repeat protein n=1 Tax=Saccharothrix saharensis TaxID=571190 RepID=A0A543JBT9_9PSEU|nr:ankyrin repeat domain-containing protein [Saccharothrix saharensis]TQM80307.1 ankyrin repeat protein [Saccharothrix saharensis]
MRDEHPVIAAAEAGDADRLAELLDAEPEAVNARGWMGTTPLIAATWKADSATAVRLLLDRGADPLAVRTNGDGALHWAASGEVAKLVTTAAGLAARHLFDRTPLHVAVQHGHVDVVRVFLDAGADPAALDAHRRTPLDLAEDPRIARLLIEAGAPCRTSRPSTPLHDACRRAASDADWVPVVELLLVHGADPGVRDEFGDLPSDLVGEHRPRELRDRLNALVAASGRSVELGPDEAAVGPQERVAVHPARPEALTTAFSGTVLVRWRLTPTIEPVEVIRVGGRKRSRGPRSGGATLAFTDGDSVWLRDWADLRRTRHVAAELPPGNRYATPVLSPDGRRLVVPSCERLHVIDLDRGEVVGELDGFGDWSVEPRFAPDGRTLAVGNSMQGTWWLTVLEPDDDGNPRSRYEREDGLPTGNGPEIVTDVAFTPDGHRFATWVRPDHGCHGPHGYRGLVATTWSRSGEPAWHLHVDDDVIGAPGQAASASLCFTPDGSWLAVGLDSGVLWLDAETGSPACHDRTSGAVNALASHPDLGLIAATDHGLRLCRPPLG